LEELFVICIGGTSSKVENMEDFWLSYNKIKSSITLLYPTDG
jgi:hypothetical protein